MECTNLNILGTLLAQNKFNIRGYNGKQLTPLQTVLIEIRRQRKFRKYTGVENARLFDIEKYERYIKMGNLLYEKQFKNFLPEEKEDREGEVYGVGENEDKDLKRMYIRDLISAHEDMKENFVNPWVKEPVATNKPVGDRNAVRFRNIDEILGSSGIQNMAPPEEKKFGGLKDKKYVDIRKKVNLRLDQLGGSILQYSKDFTKILSLVEKYYKRKNEVEEESNREMLRKYNTELGLHGQALEESPLESLIRKKKSLISTNLMHTNAFHMHLLVQYLEELDQHNYNLKEFEGNYIYTQRYYKKVRECFKMDYFNETLDEKPLSYFISLDQNGPILKKWSAIILVYIFLIYLPLILFTFVMVKTQDKTEWVLLMIIFLVLFPFEIIGAFKLKGKKSLKELLFDNVKYLFLGGISRYDTIIDVVFIMVFMDKVNTLLIISIAILSLYYFVFYLYFVYFLLYRKHKFKAASMLPDISRMADFQFFAECSSFQIGRSSTSEGQEAYLSYWKLIMEDLFLTAIQVAFLIIGDDGDSYFGNKGLQIYGYFIAVSKFLSFCTSLYYSITISRSSVGRNDPRYRRYRLEKKIKAAWKLRGTNIKTYEDLLLEYEKELDFTGNSLYLCKSKHFRTMSKYYFYLKNWGKALKYGEASLEIEKEFEGCNVSKSYCLMGEANLLNNDLREAFSNFRRAQYRDIRHYGMYNIRTIRDYINIGKTKQDLSQFWRAYAISRQLFGYLHPITIAILGRVGDAYLSHNRLAQAEQSYNDCLELIKIMKPRGPESLEDVTPEQKKERIKEYEKNIQKVEFMTIKNLIEYYFDVYRYRDAINMNRDDILINLTQDKYERMIYDLDLLLGKIYLMKGEYVKTEECYNRSEYLLNEFFKDQKNNPKYVELHKKWIEYYLKTKNIPKMHEHSNRIIQINKSIYKKDKEEKFEFVQHLCTMSKIEIAGKNEIKGIKHLKDGLNLAFINIDKRPPRPKELDNPKISESERNIKADKYNHKCRLIKQDNIDKWIPLIIEMQCELGDIYFKTNRHICRKDIPRYYFEVAESYANKYRQGDHSLFARIYINLGRFYQKLDPTTQDPIYYFLEAKKNGEELQRQSEKNYYYLALSTSCLGILYMERGKFLYKIEDKNLNFGYAGEMFEEAKRQFSDQFGEDHREVIKQIENIGDLYIAMEEYGSGIEYYGNATKALTRLNQERLNAEEESTIANENTNLKASIMHKIAHAYRKLEHYDKALGVLQEELNISREDNIRKGEIFCEKGYISMKKGEKETAVGEYSKSLKLYEKKKNEYLSKIAKIYYWRGKVYYSKSGMANNREAIENYSESMDYLDKVYEKEGRIMTSDYNQVSKQLGKCFRENNFFEEAINLYNKVQNSLLGLLDASDKQVKYMDLNACVKCFVYMGDTYSEYGKYSSSLDSAEREINRLFNQAIESYIGGVEKLESASSQIYTEKEEGKKNILIRNIYSKLGKLHFEQKDYTNAIESYKTGFLRFSEISKLEKMFIVGTNVDAPISSISVEYYSQIAQIYIEEYYFLLEDTGYITEDITNKLNIAFENYTYSLQLQKTFIEEIIDNPINIEESKEIVEISDKERKNMSMYIEILQELAKLSLLKNEPEDSRKYLEEASEMGNKYFHKQILAENIVLELADINELLVNIDYNGTMQNYTKSYELFYKIVNGEYTQKIKDDLEYLCTLLMRIGRIFLKSSGQVNITHKILDRLKKAGKALSLADQHNEACFKENKTEETTQSHDQREIEIKFNLAYINFHLMKTERAINDKIQNKQKIDLNFKFTIKEKERKKIKHKLQDIRLEVERETKYDNLTYELKKLKQEINGFEAKRKNILDDIVQDFKSVYITYLNRSKELNDTLKTNFRNYHEYTDMITNLYNSMFDYFGMNKYKEECEKILIRAPQIKQNIEYHKIMVIVYERDEKVINHLKTLIKHYKTEGGENYLSSENYRIYNEKLATLHKDLGKFDEALDCCEKVKKCYKKVIADIKREWEKINKEIRMENRIEPKNETELHQKLKTELQQKRDEIRQNYEAKAIKCFKIEEFLANIARKQAFDYKGNKMLKEKYLELSIASYEHCKGLKTIYYEMNYEYKTECMEQEQNDLEFQIIEWNIQACKYELNPEFYSDFSLNITHIENLSKLLKYNKGPKWGSSFGNLYTYIYIYII